MIEGEREQDTMAMDVARFADWINPWYKLPKIIETYQKRFPVSHPNLELPAARPLRTTAMYDIFDAMGAFWGAQYGLEVANYVLEVMNLVFKPPLFAAPLPLKQPAETSQEYAKMWG